MVRHEPRLRLLVSPPEATPADVPLTAGAVYEAYARHVANIAFRMLGRDSEVDDVVQEVFWVVVRKLPGLRDAGALRPWLTSITVNCVHKMLRRRRVRRLFHADEPDADAERGAGSPGDAHAVMIAVNRALDQLPAAQRIAWVLRRMEGEPLEEVARALRCSVTTAKRRIAAADVVMRPVVGDE